jgi:hypothetical protein
MINVPNDMVNLSMAMLHHHEHQDKVTVSEDMDTLPIHGKRVNGYGKFPSGHSKSVYEYGKCSSGHDTSLPGHGKYIIGHGKSPPGNCTCPL